MEDSEEEESPFFSFKFFLPLTHFLKCIFHHNHYVLQELEHSDYQ